MLFKAYRRLAYLNLIANRRIRSRILMSRSICLAGKGISEIFGIGNSLEVVTKVLSHQRTTIFVSDIYPPGNMGFVFIA